MSNATSLCCFGGSIITKTSLNISNRIVHTIFNTEAKEKVISGYMGIHLNSSLIHPKRSIWPHPNGLRLSGTALHMVNISPWCAWGTPDAFVLRLFSSCVKVQRTKTYLWRVEYTQWAHSQQLNPTGSHSWKADKCILLSLLTDDLTGELAGGPIISSHFTKLLSHRNLWSHGAFK